MYHLPWIVIPSVVADDRGRTRRLLAPPARERSADRPARHRWVAPSEKGRWGRKRPTVRWMARSTSRATLLTATPRAGTRRRARRTPRPCRPPPPGSRSASGAPHGLEVHPVDARDQGRDGEDRRPRGELLHDLVLADRNEGEVGLESGREELAEIVDRLVDADHVVVDVPEIHARVLRDEGDVDAHEAVADLDLLGHWALYGEEVA